MIYLGSDHAGFLLKAQIKEFLELNEIPYVDEGTLEPTRCDYVDYAYKVANKVRMSKEDKGILVCGSGQGMSIAANRVPGIRAALCNSTEMARLAREHNDANILVLGGRFIKKGKALKILKVFLNTAALDGRHEERRRKIDSILKENEVIK